ncbi:hypothetical protein GIB67_038154 [Kingdonia uniflora]|uniref:Uncharacterized protein n=1 Tax=Kingdonia uniflora TaxID=39325 RepID=A0A7J7M5E9_9MAGN|nr:hypothetical protein GIB67_038154 [Kingdonia uniflora]
MKGDALPHKSQTLNKNTSIVNEEKLSLFNYHCHLQVPRIRHAYPQLIQTALDSGVLRFGINGVSEKDWEVEKKMSEEYPNFLIPCFGLYPGLGEYDEKCYDDQVLKDYTWSAYIDRLPQ